MPEVGKPSGLVKRKGSSAYYCRLRYPLDVARRLGRAEFNRSLRTGLYAEALIRLPEARAEFDAEVLAARRRLGIIQPTTPILVRPHEFASQLTEDVAHRLALDHFRSQFRDLNCEQLPSRSSDEWHAYAR